MSRFLETIKVLDGEIYHLSYHQKRYESVLKSLDSSEIKDLKKYLFPPKNGLYRCRVIYDEKDISVEYVKYKKRQIIKLKLVYDDEIVYDKKSINRICIEKLFSKKDNADDILIVKNNMITDTSIANIALYDGKNWYTPKQALLKGTTRDRLLDDGRLILKDIYVKDIFKYEKIALLNAMIDFDIIAIENIKDVVC
jgi:4-amino-4-deoxychorismate lyase